MIFGYPLPNYLSDLISGKPGPWLILEPTTLFDLSTLGGIDHEVLVIIYENTIYLGTTIIYKWYRSRDDYCTYSRTMYADSDWNSMAIWGGWVSQETDILLGQDLQSEITENGNYYITIEATGSSVFNETVNFAVIGIPSWLWLYNPTYVGFDWKVSLSDYFDTDNYIQAGICNQPFTDGQSSPPNGIVDAKYANTPGNIDTVAIGTVTGQSQGTIYNLYGFAQASNGLYYQAGSDTIITLGINIPYTPASPPVISYRIEKGLVLSWGKSVNATRYTLKYKNYDEIYHIIDSIPGQAYQLEDLEYGVTYYFSVRGDNYLGSSDYTSETYGTTAPKSPGNIIASGITSSSISIQVSNGMIGNWDYIRVYAYQNGITPDYIDILKADYDSGLRIVTWNNLTIDLEYKFNAVTHFTINSTLLESVNWSNDLYVTTISRPSNFNWTTPKISGDPTTNLLASEWNALCVKINEFRQYKSLSTFTFTTVNSGGIFYATIFNEVRNNIADMNVINLPSTKLGISDVVDPNDADNILASDLNNIVSCLNAIE